MKTKLQVIEETAAYYAEDIKRRALDEKGVCQYITEDGRMCAVGRVMIEPELFVKENWTAEHILSDLGTDNILKSEYAIEHEGFWQDLQCFHDTTLFWDEDGLTYHGLDYLLTLRHKYAETNA